MNVWRSRDGIKHKCLMWLDKSRKNATPRLFRWSSLLCSIALPHRRCCWNFRWTVFHNYVELGHMLKVSLVPPIDCQRAASMTMTIPNGHMSPNTLLHGGARDIYIELRTKTEASLSELPLSFLILICKPSSRTLYPLSSVDSRI